MGFLIDILAFIFILGAAVVLHEFGHFAVAKLLKIRVETFSVGFGPRIFGRRWGTTDYRLSAIPLGGYVKLGGDESNAPIEGAGASDIPPEEQFNLRPRWQRIAVAVAGPVMNVLTALAIPFAGAIIFGVPATPAPIVSRVKDGGAAATAGLRRGDRIVSFNQRENPTWRYIEGEAMLAPGQSLPLVVERDGQQIAMNIKPNTRRVGSGENVGELDFYPEYGNVPVIIKNVVENSGAAEAGLQPGDRIINIDNESAVSSGQVTQYIRDHKAEPIHLTVERNGELKEIVANVRRMPDGQEILGIGYRPPPLERVGVLASANYAVRSNIEILRLTGKALGQVFSGQRSARETVSGPIGIARASSMAVREGGIDGVFMMLAFLSLNLGIFNLLPVPVLDGGAIFLLLVEGALAWVGIKLSTTVRERIQQVGFVMLLLLMGFVITNDLIKEVGRFFG